MTEEYETVEMTVRVARESGETMATLTDRHGTHIDYHETSGGVRRALEALLPGMVDHVEQGETPAAEVVQPLRRLRDASRRDAPPMAGGSRKAA